MKNKKARILISLTLCLAMTVSLASCGNKGSDTADSDASEASKASTETPAEAEAADEASEEDSKKASLFSSDNSGNTSAKGTYTEGLFVRPTLIDMSLFTTSTDSVEARSASYTVAVDLSNVMNGSDYVDFDEGRERLVRDGFYVRSGYSDEFYEVYENNRYSLEPNFVTVDSLMHTYHLYFAHLLKNTEKNGLYDSLLNLTDRMLDASINQHMEMRASSKSDASTEAWEMASDRNIAFFAVAKALLDESYDPAKDSMIDKDTVGIIKEELSLINEAEGISVSPLSGDDAESEDYSQYKPRGYYDGDETLSRYFKTMMWYGRRNFKQKSESMDRSALLMTIAMDDEAYDDWSVIYAVTSFFAGASDDNGVCEYLPLIEEAYGKSRGDITGLTVMDED